jgi:glycosidase
VNFENNVKVRKVDFWIRCQHPVYRIDVVKLIENPGVGRFVEVIQFHLGFEHLVD